MNCETHDREDCYDCARAAYYSTEDRLRYEVERLRGALEGVINGVRFGLKRYAETGDGLIASALHRAEEVLDAGTSPPSAAPVPGTGMEPGPCSICGGAREVLRDGGPYCRECHQSGDPVEPAPPSLVGPRLRDNGTLLERVEMRLEKVRYGKHEVELFAEAAVILDAIEAHLASQPVPVVDPVDAILAVECPVHFGVGKGACDVQVIMNGPNRPTVCYERIRRASRTTTKGTL